MDGQQAPGNVTTTQPSSGGGRGSSQEIWLHLIVAPPLLKSCSLHLMNRIWKLTNNGTYWLSLASHLQSVLHASSWLICKIS